MKETTKLKLDRLNAELRNRTRVLTALSGGVDSTLCQHIAHEALGYENAIAVTAKSETLTSNEFDAVCALARERGWNHRIIEYSELQIPNYASNPVNRCYFCKLELFGRMAEVARETGCTCIIEGTNYDDRGDYRPGMQAADEIGTFAPLLSCEVTKEEIREMAREFGLPNWSKPSGACLSSRFPYGEEITHEGLERVAKSEAFLRSLGFTQLRVRHHGRLARVELLPAEIPRVFSENLAPVIFEELLKFGFTYVTLDMRGYRTGSMNEVLKMLTVKA